MLKTDEKRRKYHSRQNKIMVHDVRNIGILNIELYMNVFVRGNWLFSEKLTWRFLFVLPLYNAFK